MTEKRFENKGRVIYDSQTYDEYHCDFFAGLEEITDLLNEQQVTINRLEEENGQLKQFKQNVFGLIDKSLEKDKHDYEMTYEDYLNGRIEVLEDLKKELLE